MDTDTQTLDPPVKKRKDPDAVEATWNDPAKAGASSTYLGPAREKACVRAQPQNGRTAQVYQARAAALQVCLPGNHAETEEHVDHQAEA